MMKLLNSVSLRNFSLSVLALTMVATNHVSAREIVDAALPNYQKTSGISGNISSIGSDTLANIMTLWAESFKHHYPKVRLQIQAAGSATAPPALTDGTSSIAPMSRMMAAQELAAFESKYGYQPTAIPVAIDALAVFVHKDNPISHFSIQDIDSMFSSTRKCGSEKSLKRWGEAGLTDEWANRNIALFGRNSISGTHGYFKEKSLCDGDFVLTVKEQPGSASVIQSVSSTVNGVGYSGIGYQTANVRVVPLSKQPGGAPVYPNAEQALTGEYPLSRLLYVYVNKAPNKPLAPLQREFMKLILSKAGQQLVVKDGYFPIPATLAQQQREILGLL